jgi:PPOX class probable F420-dependent enzyme
MTGLPQLARELLDGPNFATVVTLQPDGAPQASIVWVKRNGDDVLFSTIRGRRKTTNLETDPRTTVVITDVASPYRYAEVRGRAEITDDPTAALIHELARKYTGQPFDLPPGQERVIVRVRPAHVVSYDD